MRGSRLQGRQISEKRRNCHSSSRACKEYNDPGIRGLERLQDDDTLHAWHVNHAYIAPVRFITKYFVVTYTWTFSSMIRPDTGFYLFMQEGIERFGCRVLAFCLMAIDLTPLFNPKVVLVFRLVQNFPKTTPSQLVAHIRRHYSNQNNHAAISRKRLTASGITSSRMLPKASRR